MAAAAKKAPAKATTSKVAKSAASGKAPAKKAVRPVKTTLMRDLHSLSEAVEQKSLGVVRLCGDLDNLVAKVNAVSTEVEKAQKDHDERVGKVEKDILDYELAGVQKALKKHNKIAVDSFEIKMLREMQRTGEGLKGKTNDEIAKEVAERVAEKVRFQEVMFAEEYAGAQAKEAAFEVERGVLQSSIASLRLEVESQKCLSSEIAKANQQKKITAAKKKLIEEQQAKEDAIRAAQAGLPHGLIPTAAVAPIPAAATPAMPRKVSKIVVKGKQKAPEEKELDTVTEEDTLSDDQPEPPAETPKLKRKESDEPALARTGSVKRKKSVTKKTTK